MKKLTTIVLIVLAALAVTVFASGGPGCCLIPTASATTSQREAVTTLHIEGMTCGACATAVKQVLKKVDGVRDDTRRGDRLRSPVRRESARRAF